MQVLLLTLILVFVMSIMTYSQMESFKDFEGFKSLFKHYIEVQERSVANALQFNAYDNAHVGNAADTPQNPPQQPPANAPARISVYYFLNDQNPPAGGDVKAQQRYLLKRLMESLYSDQPFYKRAVDEAGSQFLDQLLDKLAEASNRYRAEKPLTKTEQLAEIQLNVPIYDEVFHKMMRGIPVLDSLGKKPANSSKGSEEKVEVEEEGTEASSQLDEPPIRAGSESLLDYITLQKSDKVRFWLASPATLHVLFPGINVDAILRTRKEIYNAIKNLEAPVYAKLRTEYELMLKSEFETQRDPALSDKTIDFSISKTNPSRYCRYFKSVQTYS